MRKLSQNLGLGLLSSLFLVIPACGDDTGGNETTTAGTTGHSTATHGNTTVGATSVGTTSVGTTSVGTTSVGATTAGTTSAGTTATTTGGTNTTTTTTGGTTDTTGGTGGNGDQASVHALIGELCAWNGRCCDAGEFSYIFGNWTKDVETCKTRMIAFYNSNEPDQTDAGRISEVGHIGASLLRTLAFNVSSTRSTPVKAEVDKCTAYIKTLDCNTPTDKYCSTKDDPKDAPCRLVNMFKGTLGKDARCNSNLTGHDNNIECKEGYSCVETSGTSNVHTCVAHGKLGETCSPVADPNGGKDRCEEGLYCDAGGKCAKRPVLGEACSYVDFDEPELDELKVPCARDYMCDPVAKKCVLDCSVGDKCTLDSECPSDHSCVPYEINGAAVENFNYCRPTQAIGGFCDTDHDCTGNAFCDRPYTQAPGGADPVIYEATGRCKAALAASEKCLFDYECGDGGYCDDDEQDDSTVVQDLDPDNDPATDDGTGDGTCEPRISSADADNGKCENEGHRSCFDGSAGCFEANAVMGDGAAAASAFRCMAKGTKIPKNDRCTPTDGADADYLKFMAEASWAPFLDATAAPAASWINHCETGVCHKVGDNANNFSCAAGLGEGESGCDYRVDDVDNNTCNPGLVCVDNKCRKWLMPGEECKKSYHDVTVDANGNTLNNVPTIGSTALDGVGESHAYSLCMPGSLCTEIAGGFYCSVVKRDRRVAACDGGGASAE